MDTGRCTLFKDIHYETRQDLDGYWRVMWAKRNGVIRKATTAYRDVGPIDKHVIDMKRQLEKGGPQLGCGLKSRALPSSQPTVKSRVQTPNTKKKKKSQGSWLTMQCQLLEGGDQEDRGSKPGRAKSTMDSLLPLHLNRKKEGRGGTLLSSQLHETCK
jgi:hypothetical protein